MIAEGMQDVGAFAEDSPAMLWRGDHNGRCVYLNAAMRAFWGLQPADCLTFEWASSLLEEDQPAVFGPFSQGMATQEPFECEGRYRRADGAIRILRTKATPYHAADGSFGGMIGVNEDITDLRQVQREMVEQSVQLARALEEQRAIAERLRLATDTVGLAMSEHDDAMRYVWAQNLPESVIGKMPSELVGPSVGQPLEEMLRRTLTTHEPQHSEMAVMVGQKSVWFDVRTRPVVGKDGRVRILASALDVTVRKLNEQKLAVLARELGHRVKNVFSIATAIVRQSSRAHNLPGAFGQTVEARLRALAEAQNDLLAMDEAGVSLPALLKRQLSHMDAIHLTGAEVQVPGHVAPYVALAVHELATNALKYGRLGAHGGSVNVEWQVADSELRLHWEERGGSPPPDLPHKGFGTSLLTRIFAQATGGTVDYGFGTEGARWVATIPLSDAIELQ